MRHITSTTLAVLLLVGCAGAAFAQAGVVGLGARVRVTTVSGGLSPGQAQATQIEGVLVEVTDRTIAIRVDRLVDQARVNRSSIAQMERAVGYRSRARKGALGALIGAASGAALLLALPCEGGSDWFCGAGFRASTGGVLGAGAGAITGVVLPPAIRWVVVPTSALTADPDRSPFSSVTGGHDPRSTRLLVMVGAGTTAGGPAGDLEAAMRAGGFADAAPGWTRPIPHPSSNTGFEADGAPVWVDARYSVRDPWSVSVQYSRAPIGVTSGYRRPGHYLFVNYEVWTLAATVARRQGPLVLGVGPAMFTGRSQLATPGADGWVSHSRSGLLAEALVHVPSRTRVFLDVRLQYRFVGRLTTGPFTPSGTTAGQAPFLASDVRFNHWLIGIGPGVRF